MADLYLTPAEKYTAALGGFYYGDLPEPGTVYTQLIKDILDGSTPDKVPKNILARFIYSLYISDLGDPYPRYELAKLLYWKLHNITPTKSGSILTVTIDGKKDYMTINTDLSRLWYKVLFGSKTDVITEFPYIFNTMQNKLSDWELFGNTVQDGTPTPQNPVMPQGTGERTGNLAQWEKGGINTSTGANEAYRTKEQGGTCEQMRTLYIPCAENTTYILHTNLYPVQTFISYYDANKIYISRSSGAPQGENRVFTTPETARYMRAQLAHVAADQVYPAIEENQQYAIMLGSPPLPYEPYGIKIPISSNSVTTPVYLGEVQTTRKIKKLVLTGEESLVNAGGNAPYRLPINDIAISPSTTSIEWYCSHYQSVSTNDSWVSYDYCISRASATTQSLQFRDVTKGDITAFKQYLAAQYAAGTPVTVWYVLAEPETGIVNEPLMKIGDHADSMSRAQTGIDIPTVIGQNTLDVLTTVKPSSMSIEYTSADENRSRSKRISLLKSPLTKNKK